MPLHVRQRVNEQGGEEEEEEVAEPQLGPRRPWIVAFRLISP